MSLENTSETSKLETGKEERLTGCVKWFNNKAGYGFITVTTGAKTGTDVFVHHSFIRVSNEQYKYLVQGEYVDFLIVSTNGGVHEFQASDVSGVKSGKLMCETRREFRISRSNYTPVSNDKQSEELVKKHEEVKMPRSKKVTKKPIVTNENVEGLEAKSWTPVVKKSLAKQTLKGDVRKSIVKPSI